METFKRFMHIILIIAIVGGTFLIYNISESWPASVRNQGAPEREFIETKWVDEGKKPRVWLLGDSRSGQMYGNVRQFCQDLRLTVAGEGKLNLDEVEERDLVIFCDPSVSRWADPAELAEFITAWGAVLFWLLALERRKLLFGQCSEFRRWLLGMIFMI